MDRGAPPSSIDQKTRWRRSPPHPATRTHGDLDPTFPEQLPRSSNGDAASRTKETRADPDAGTGLSGTHAANGLKGEDHGVGWPGERLMEQPAQSRRNRRKSTEMIDLFIDRFDAVIFDMDGVVTDSAVVHEHCWKAVFDDFLRARADHSGEDLRPFDEDDYLHYVDGKPRYEGAASFLASRRIELERGAPSDPPGHETVCALANLKDRDFELHVSRDGVPVFDSTISLIHSLRSYGVKTALISSSRHATVLLESAQIAEVFDVVIDGVEAEAVGLAGKPDPAIFLAAASRLHVAPFRAVVVEDAEAGVEAGRRGGFGFVLGIDRGAHADALRRHGASAVVTDLREVALRPRNAAERS